MVRRHTRRTGCSDARALAAGVAICGLLGFAGPAYGQEPSGGAGGMGANCPMGQNGEGTAGSGPSPTNQSSGAAPLSVGGAATSRSAPAPRTAPGPAPAAQAVPVAQPVSAPAQATTGATAQAAASTPAAVTAAVPVAQPSAQALARARKAERRAKARRAAARRAAAAERVRKATARTRTARAERWLQAAPKGEPLPLAATTQASAPAGPPIVLLAVGLLGIAALGAAVLRRRRGTGGVPVVEAPVVPPPADGAAIEAELQEIIAEERAARLLDERDTLARH